MTTDRPDETLRAAYRGLPPEEPAPALDAAVLGAARQSVARRSHNWLVPVSLAAVLVLSVAVTLRVAEEQPEIRTAPPSPPASGEIAKPAVPSPDSKADAPLAEPEPQAKTRVRPETPSAGRAAMPVPSAPAKEETSVAAAPAFVPSPRRMRRNNVIGGSAARCSCARDRTSRGPGGAVGCARGSARAHDGQEQRRRVEPCFRCSAPFCRSVAGPHHRVACKRASQGGR